MRRFPIVVAILALGLVVVAALLSDKFREVLDNRPRVSTPASTPASTPEPTPDPSTLYILGEATLDGTGKFYLGREIAQVMGHQAINWLERSNRDAEEATTRATAALQLSPDAVIADIGAGSGYYSFRLAKLVPQGRVVAVDIQPEMLGFLAKRRKELNITNVEPHLGSIDDVQLPANSIDAALMVDAYHEFSHPYEMMRSLHHALRPGGRIFLLEYRAEDPDVPIKPLHKMSQEQAKREMETAGFDWVRTDDFLPWQHFMVFQKPG
jgi:FkbM family methyltransferase